MKRWKKLLILLLALGIALSYRSIEQSTEQKDLLFLSDSREKVLSQIEAENKEQFLVQESAEAGNVTDFLVMEIVESIDALDIEATMEIDESFKPVTTVSISESGEESLVSHEEPEADVRTSLPDEEHQHVWIDEIVAYHDAVTHTVHHDAQTEQRWVSVPVKVDHFYCDVCGMEFLSSEDAYAHEDATYEAAIEACDMSLAHVGHYSITEMIDRGYYETVIVQEAYDEIIVDEPAWEEHVFRCSVCGATG